MRNLTAYQLACGHVQEIKKKTFKVELYKEHSVYHVRSFDYFIDGRLIQRTWLVFDTLVEARKAFKRQYDIGMAV